MSPEQIHNSMIYNNTYKLTIFKDWTESGKQYWRILHGMESYGGFDVGGMFNTRQDALDLCLKVLDHAHNKTKVLPLVFYEHGHRKGHWLDRSHYFKTGEIRSN